MSIKKTLLAAALAAFAFTALPALASAEVTGAHVSKATEFTIDQDSEQVVLFTEEIEIACESFHGDGEFEDTTTGDIKLTFHGCTALGFNCTTPGQPTGTITTTTLPIHVEPVNEEPAVLITPNEGHFASFVCFIIGVEITGNGLIGTVADPGWTEETDDATIEFTQTDNVQDHLTTDTDETVWDLKASGETAGLEFASVLTFDDEIEFIDTGEATE